MRNLCTAAGKRQGSLVPETTLAKPTLGKCLDLYHPCIVSEQNPATAQVFLRLALGYAGSVPPGRGTGVARRCR